MPKVIEVITEADLQGAITDLCTWLGIKWYHVTDSRKDPSGWPDLVLSGRHGTIFRELKSATGRMRPEQKAWLFRLDESGQDAAVWRPADWRSGRIRRELEAIR